MTGSSCIACEVREGACKGGLNAMNTFVACSVAINLISIFVYTGHHWPALRAELRPPEQVP